MRSLISLLSLSLFASAAHADDTPAAPAPSAPSTPIAAPSQDVPTPMPAPVTLSHVDRNSIPEACDAHARFVSSWVRPIALRQRLALATCLTRPSLASVTSVLDTHESMTTLENAVSQSMRLLDEVIALGDASQQAQAAHAKGALYEELLARMANSVPLPTTGGSALALYDSRKALLDIMLQPWREQAVTAHRLAIAIGKTVPNNATASTVARSEQRLQRLVAAAPPIASADATAAAPDDPTAAGASPSATTEQARATPTAAPTAP